jgi:hypothetical protein
MREASHVQCRPAYADVRQAANVLLQYNFTYFFDINATASKIFTWELNTQLRKTA